MEESSEKEQKLLDNYIEHVHNKFNTWVIIIIPIIIVIIIISTISIPVITIQYTWQSLYLFTKQTFLPGTLMDSSSVSFLILSYRLDRYTPNLVISDWYLDFCLDHLHKNPNICVARCSGCLSIHPDDIVSKVFLTDALLGGQFHDYGINLFKYYRLRYTIKVLFQKHHQGSFSIVNWSTQASDRGAPFEWDNLQPDVWGVSKRCRKITLFKPFIRVWECFNIPKHLIISPLNGFPNYSWLFLSVFWPFLVCFLTFLQCVPRFSSVYFWLFLGMILAFPRCVSGFLQK